MIKRKQITRQASFV